MPEITATVVAKSEWGIQIKEGEWWNWSKPEYRGEPFNTEVQKGDRVQITYAQTDGGKTYITTIGKVTASDPLASTEEQPAHRGLQAEDFSDTTSEPLEPARREKSTNESIEGQVALKAAIELVIAKGDEPNLEKWVGAVMYAFEVFRDALEP